LSTDVEVQFELTLDENIEIVDTHYPLSMMSDYQFALMRE
jgi:hypothetical protein